LEKLKETRTKNKEQRIKKNKEQRTYNRSKSKEQRTKEQRAKSKEQRAFFSFSFVSFLLSYFSFRCFLFPNKEMEPGQTVWPPEEEKTNKLNLCFSSRRERNIFLQSKHQRFETIAICC